MTKTISINLKAAFAQETTTVARFAKATWEDGTIWGFTSLDVDFDYDGVTYLADGGGITPSTVEMKADLSVANMELAGFLSNDAITEDDLRSGKWDGALVEVFDLDYMHPEYGEVRYPGYVVGNVSAGRNVFMAEVRSLSQLLQKSIGRMVTGGCSWRFGDANCGYNVEALRVTGMVTGIAGNRRTFTDTARGEADNYFRYGEVTWTSGLNIGLKAEVRDYAADTFTLAFQMPFDIAGGDTYSAIPGCAKRFEEDCRDTWANSARFGGFPHVPGNDVALGNGGITS